MTSFLEPGTSISHYRVVDRIGSGGMGEVYLADDVQLGRRVALKILPPEAAHQKERLERFEREARAASRLNHPNILIIHDFIVFDGRSILVTEYVEGETLRSRLARAPIPLQEALEIAIQIADGLAAAHAAGIVHRDVKPENVMLRRDGSVKIVDFGLAKELRVRSEGDTSSPTVSRSQTEPGVVMGSFHYMSPEQARGQEVDARTDVFSLGALTHEMILGHPPFRGPTPSDVIASILGCEPEPVRVSSPSTPPELERIVSRALAKERGERYPVVADMLRDLQSLKSGIEGPSARRARRRPSKKRVDSLAVLPLVNESGDPETDYLSEGIADTVIIRLSQLPRLQVMSRSAAFRYKGRDADPIAAGRELGVKAVLAGRLFHRREGLRVTMELVDVETGFQLWGESYDQRLADIFAIQDEIAEEVSERLKLKLTGDERNRLLKRQTGDVQAYQEFCRGRHAWELRTEEALKKAKEHFERAIGRDPSYGLAYAGLADAYAILGMAEYGILFPPDSMPRSRAAAERALQLDASLASQARTTLAHLTAFFDWKWREAEEQFQEGIARDPKYPYSHHWYALMLAALGRFEEAIEEEKRARALDPLSLIINKNVGTLYYYARENGKAIDEYRKAMELDPDFVRTHYFLALSLLAEGDDEKAAGELNRAIELAGENTVFLATLGYAKARAGRDDEAREILARLERRAERGYVPALNPGLVYIGLGDLDAAFERMERALEERSSWLVSLNTEPLFDALRTTRGSTSSPGGWDFQAGRIAVDSLSERLSVTEGEILAGGLSTGLLRVKRIEVESL